MLVFWIIVVFIVGACVGSFLNVCIYRLPLEKSIIWPGSRCGSCLQPIRWQDNIPLLSYWLLRGRCRQCGTEFSAQYFGVELLTAFGFVGLFCLAVVENVHGFPVLMGPGIVQGDIPWQGWVIFTHHALLLSFLIAAAFCDLQHREIPLGITTTGTIVGLIFAILWPWPWPETPGWALRTMRPGDPWWFGGGPDMGLYGWPLWGPLPAWLPAESWQLGLATGIAGVLVGTFMVRGIRFLFGLGTGVEALGLGDADLMMMAGAFLGWQPVVVAFFIGSFFALFIGVLQLLRSGDNALAFGPSLALGILVTCLAWSSIGRELHILFFNEVLLGVLIVGAAVILIVASVVIRLLRWLRGVPQG